MKSTRTLLIGIFIFLLSACTSVAPDFQPDSKIITHFRLGDFQSLKVGEVSGANEKIEKISIRGGKMKSPYKNSYVAYLKEALEIQLKYSNIWDENSLLKIDAVFLNNKLDASGVDIGIIELSAEFSIYESNKKVYQNTHVISHQWSSSFVGAIAIPAAQQNYQVAIHKLLNDFLLSNEVLKILKIE